MKDCSHLKTAPVYVRRKARGAGQVLVLGRLCLDCYQIAGGPDGARWELVEKRRA